MSFPLTEHIAKSARHTTFYLACGAGDAPLNHQRNGEFAQRAVNNGRLTMPLLFLHAAYDYTCETVESRLAEPMRQECEKLSEVTVRSGHWMAQERPTSVNAAIARWLAREFPELWKI